MLQSVEEEIKSLSQHQQRFAGELNAMEVREGRMNCTVEVINHRLQGIEQQKESLQAFIDANDSQVLTLATLPNHIVESDPFSKQVINTLTENKAIKDSYLYIDNAFKRNKIDFETALKVTSNFAAKEFMNHEILNKCKQAAL